MSGLVHDGSEGGRVPEGGTGLCLSGGGYRAMLFHVGALWRLNEAGWLPRLDRVSSVSGGSITAATLGVAWPRLDFDDNGVAVRFKERCVAPLRHVASKTIDRAAIVLSVLGRDTVGERVASAYRKLLFGDRTLQDLPVAGAGPRFVINAANISSGTLWRFSQPYMADYRVGMVEHPRVPLASAVAASSAFPPVLSPLRLTIAPAAYTDDSRGWELHREPFISKVVLTDGGVYDNLGLETVWKGHRTVLVSDGGGQLQPEVSPHTDWLRHSKRVLSVIDNQVRSLRKRQLIDSFVDGQRLGAYWGIRTDVADYPLADPLPCPVERIVALAATPTRLAAMPAALQEALINWGYAVCDAALRAHVDLTAKPPQGFPYPATGLG